MAVNFKPDGYNSLTPFFMLEDCMEFESFITKVFDAKPFDVTRKADGTIMHGDYIIGDSHLMFAAASEQYPVISQMVYVYVEDVDAVYKKAVEAGGESLREPTDEFYGDRSCGIMDKCGNQWWIATHVEDVSKDELEKRMSEWMKNKEAIKE
jgi:PhnB protein